MLRALLLAALCAAGCSHKSAPAQTCIDQVRNQDESDVDCGGYVCPACGPGRACAVDHDCQSKLCGSDGVCLRESCSDGVKNGSESDIDCGGPDCPPCDDARQCAGANDCKSIVCVGGTCQAPTCSDGFQNGSETGIDCGGPCPPCSGD